MKSKRGILQFMYFLYKATRFTLSLFHCICQRKEEKPSIASGEVSLWEILTSPVLTLLTLLRAVRWPLQAQFHVWQQPCATKVSRETPQPRQVSGFPYWLCSVQLSANFINTQIQTHQNRQCPEAPAGGKQTSLNNPGGEAKGGVRKHPWATSHC